MKFRVCLYCKDYLPLDSIHFHKRGSGFKSTCKICRSVKAYKRYIENKEDILSKNKIYRENNLEKRRECCKKSYKKHKQNKFEYYIKNKEKQLLQKQKNANTSILYNSKIFEYLKFFEETRKDPENTLLGQVKCKYCGNWFNPNNRQCYNRKFALKNNKKGLNLYCSDNCKVSCSIYGQILYPKGFKKSTSREVNAVLRKIVLDRDNYKCQKCEATTDDTQLHVHHIKSFTQNTMLANDPDNCITLCKECHREVHSDDGCKYHELKCVA